MYQGSLIIQREKLYKLTYIPLLVGLVPYVEFCLRIESLNIKVFLV